MAEIPVQEIAMLVQSPAVLVKTFETAPFCRASGRACLRLSAHCPCTGCSSPAAPFRLPTIQITAQGLIFEALLMLKRHLDTQQIHLQHPTIISNCFNCCASTVPLQAFPEGGLVYFNHGPASGMSLPHKHLQIVPLPLGAQDSESALPTGPILEAAVGSKPLGSVVAVRQFPYKSYACRIDDRCGLLCYCNMHRALECCYPVAARASHKCDNDCVLTGITSAPFGQAFNF